jgi:hypothetical protein
MILMQRSTTIRVISVVMDVWTIPRVITIHLLHWMTIRAIIPVTDATMKKHVTIARTQQLIMTHALTLDVSTAKLAITTREQDVMTARAISPVSVAQIRLLATTIQSPLLMMHRATIPVSDALTLLL